MVQLRLLLLLLLVVVLLLLPLRMRRLHLRVGLCRPVRARRVLYVRLISRLVCRLQLLLQKSRRSG